jgi:hypothetical protein
MIKSNGMQWAVRKVQVLEKCMELLVAKHGVRRPPGRFRYRWEVGWEDVSTLINSGLHKRHIISSVAEEVLDSQEGSAS